MLCGGRGINSNMNIPLVLQTLGNLIILLSGILFIPFGVSLFYGTKEEIWAFVISIIASGITGLILKFALKPRNENITIERVWRLSHSGGCSVPSLEPCLTGFQGHVITFVIPTLNQ